MRPAPAERATAHAAAILLNSSTGTPYVSHSFRLRWLPFELVSMLTLLLGVTAGALTGVVLGYKRVT